MQFTDSYICRKQTKISMGMIHTISGQELFLGKGGGMKCVALTDFK